ncbi:hypothetical protein PVAP13_3NG309550 [Panicum virgatum]|uniref:Uncharacterized protein n=1 Tax=Panicum virgatum TaxID=38727 RepID=A0A8T0UHK1_PANVG|nr:hypothetical protein PVAP13_3NG309550 [Panicum virgatum]
MSSSSSPLFYSPCRSHTLLGLPAAGLAAAAAQARRAPHVAALLGCGRSRTSDIALNYGGLPWWPGCVGGFRSRHDRPGFNPESRSSLFASFGFASPETDRSHSSLSHFTFDNSGPSRSPRMTAAPSRRSRRLPSPLMPTSAPAARLPRQLAVPTTARLPRLLTVPTAACSTKSSRRRRAGAGAKAAGWIEAATREGGREGGWKRSSAEAAREGGQAGGRARAAGRAGTGMVSRAGSEKKVSKGGGFCKKDSEGMKRVC